MSVLTDGPKIDLAETLKTWLVPAMTIQNHSLKLSRIPRAVASTFLALFDIYIIGQRYGM